MEPMEGSIQLLRLAQPSHVIIVLGIVSMVQCLQGVSSVHGRSCGHRVNFHVMSCLGVIVARTGASWRCHRVVGEDELSCFGEVLHQGAVMVCGGESRDIFYAWLCPWDLYLLFRGLHVPMPYPAVGYSRLRLRTPGIIIFHMFAEEDAETHGCCRGQEFRERALCLKSSGETESELHSNQES